MARYRVASDENNTTGFVLADTDRLLVASGGSILRGSGPAAQFAGADIAATILNAGAANKRAMWQGIGHGATVYSPCALAPVMGYLDSGKAPETDTYCPA